MPQNQLINETSPYLLQHASNPVHWLPWNPDVFKRAEKENKLVLISVGYSACHWCHVMEHESFSDAEVAALMNKNFLCIKVDREERPDVDHIYMMAVQMMTGRGGWPLNCFTLPNGLPVFGGTYYPKSQWLEILNALHDAHQKTPAKLEEFGEKLKAGIKENDFIATKSKTEFDGSQLKQSVDRMKSRFDKEHGGMQRAPKFPLPATWRFLLDFGILEGDNELTRHVAYTLEKISYGGIYDHVGGGFFRYSVDEKWMVPHFEKMLYDNAQLATLYADAWMHFKNPRFKKVLEETLDFLEKDFQAKNGGLYSAYDADSEGVEGKYYVWTADQINALSVDNSDAFKTFFHIKEGGNWEEKNILHATQSLESFANKRQMDSDDLENKFDQCLQNLKKERDARIKPLLDTKQLASWNGMALTAFSKGYAVTGNKHYHQTALKIAGFIEADLMSDQGLQRKYTPDKSFRLAFLDDYAFVISGYISLFLAGFDVGHLKTANNLVQHCMQKFYHKDSGMFFYTEEENNELFDRKMELSDTVIPSSNSEMAAALYVLGTLLGKHQYREMSAQMIQNMAPAVIGNPSYYANWGMQLLKHVFPFNEIIVTGKDAIPYLKKLNHRHFPNAFIIASEQEENLPVFENRVSPLQTQVFVCSNQQCDLPTNDLALAKEKITALYKM